MITAPRKQAIRHANMVNKVDSISDYRSKLDNTLASSDLTTFETVHTLVKNQISQSSSSPSNSHFQDFSDNVVDKRSNEVYNFLGMLRSASANDDVNTSKSTEEPNRAGWKVKQDTGEFRVMYIEGPEGTPFHTLLVEGYVDGPVDACLCISCESDLYSRWWPQTSIPPFKVVSSRCVKRVRSGEQISLVRMKVPWPVSSREALVHFFAFEYFKDGLTVVLLSSIADSEIIDVNSHGFSRDGIPDAQDIVRIDVVGGFALQKVTEERSYFRTIVNMDIKLDFVPPWFINFASRQLISSGFKLYKKEVDLISKGDEKFVEALRDSLYIRIRESLYSENTSKVSPFEVETADDNAETIKGNHGISSEIEEVGENNKDEEAQVSCDDLAGEISEIEPREEEINGKKKVEISPKVDEALGTLERLILFVREYNHIPGKADQTDAKNCSESLETDSTEPNVDEHRNRLENQTKVTEDIVLGSKASKRRIKKSRNCCFYFFSGSS